MRNHSLSGSNLREDVSSTLRYASYLTIDEICKKVDRDYNPIIDSQYIPSEALKSKVQEIVESLPRVEREVRLEFSRESPIGAKKVWLYAFKG